MRVLLVLFELGYAAGDYGMLRARATTIGPWEVFQVQHETDPDGTDSDVLQSIRNLNYVSAEFGYSGDSYAMLRARATTIGQW